MSLEGLTPKQNEFLEKYIRDKSWVKGKVKKGKAKKYVLSIRSLDSLLGGIEKDDRQVAWTKERQEIIKLADDGRFREARGRAEQLEYDIKLNAKPDLKEMQRLFGEVQSKTELARRSMDKYIQWRDQSFKDLLSQLGHIPRESLPTAQEGSEEWAQELSNLIRNKREVMKQVQEQVRRNQSVIEGVRRQISQATNALQALRFDISRRQENPPNKAYREAINQLDESVRNLVVPENIRNDKNDPKYKNNLDLGEVWQEEIQREVSQAQLLLEHQLLELEDDLAWAEWEPNHEDFKQNDLLKSEISKDRENTLMNTGNPKPRPVRRLKTFDSAPFLKNLGDFVFPFGGGEEKSPEFQKLVREGQEGFKKYLDKLALNPESDEMQDLMLKSVEDFQIDYLVSRGWSQEGWSSPKNGGLLIDEKKIGKNRVQTAKAYALGMHAAMMEKQTDKFVLEGESMSMTLGGKKYTGGQVIGQGGMGKVMRFHEEGNPQRTVVVKSMLAPSNHSRRKIVHEVKNHRRLMENDEEGEISEGRENVVGLKKALQTPTGELLMVMEEVSGGDLQENRFGLSVASETGVLPEEARILLNQLRLKQATEGLKYMRGKNMVHFDIKGANLLLSDDGTMKVADFGSSGMGVKDDGTVEQGEFNATTKGMNPGFDQKGDDESFDTYSLGKLAQVMEGNRGLPAINGDLSGEMQSTNSLDRLASSMTNPDPNKRISLEGVLQSSYLSNLKGYNEKDLEELSRLTIQYTKALKKNEGKMASTVLDALDICDKNRVKITLLRKEHDREEESPSKSVEPNPPQSDRMVEIEKQISQLEEEIKVAKGRIAEIGNSGEAKELGAQIKEVSMRLIHPSARPEDIHDLMNFLETLSSTTSDLGAFSTMIGLSASREALRMFGVDPIELHRAFSFYTMKTSEHYEQTKERKDREETWDPRKLFTEAKNSAEQFIAGVEDSDLQQIFIKVFSKAYAEVNQRINAELKRQQDDMEEAKAFAGQLAGEAATPASFASFVREPSTHKCLTMLVSSEYAGELMDVIKCYDLFEEQDYQKLEPGFEEAKKKIDQFLSKEAPSAIKDPLAQGLDSIFKLLDSHVQQVGKEDK